MKRSLRPSTSSKVSGSLERQLSTYALVAGAAGVGVLAFALPAEAKVIYTPAHLDATFYELDLNHDGVTDFYFFFGSSCESNCFEFFSLYGKSGSVRRNKKGYGAALRRGAYIGPKRVFERYARMISWGTSAGSTLPPHGPWVNVKKRYLGLKFKIGDETHYGWARLNVRAEEFLISPTLTGYAYETIPDKPIVAGDRGSTTGAGRGVPAEPVSLGHLALGRSGSKQHRPNRVSSH